MKKILALLLALATLFAVVGCATQTPAVNESSEEASEEDPTTVGTQSTEKPTESAQATPDPKTTEPVDKGGCGSVIGSVGAALASLVGAVCILKKKKD